MSPTSDLADILRALARALAADGTRWYLFGAQAVAVYGVPRLTADVDATIDIPLEHGATFVRTMADSGFDQRVDDIDAFARKTRVLPLVHRATGIPVDLVLAGPGLEEEFLDRAQEVDIEGVAVPVISPEDLLVTKILAGRPKDLEDVRGIVQERGSDLDLDRPRRLLRLLEEALDRHDLVSRLDEITRQRGL